MPGILWIRKERVVFDEFSYDEVCFSLQLRGIQKVLLLAETHIMQFQTFTFLGQVLNLHTLTVWCLQNTPALKSSVVFG